MYDFTFRVPCELAAALQPVNRQCYAEMEDGSMIPVTVVPANCDLNDPSTTEMITVVWSQLMPPAEPGTETLTYKSEQ